MDYNDDGLYACHSFGSFTKFLRSAESRECERERERESHKSDLMLRFEIFPKCRFVDLLVDGMRGMRDRPRREGDRRIETYRIDGQGQRVVLLCRIGVLAQRERKRMVRRANV